MNTDYQYLKWSTMAIDAAFGLEYKLNPKAETSKQHTFDLIQSGISICQLLEVVIIDATPINQYQLESYHAQKSLSDDPEKLKAIVEKANETKIFLQSILDGYNPSEQQIREYQRFFNELCTPWQNKEISRMRMRHGFQR